MEMIRENAHGRRHQRCLRRKPANLSLEGISLQGLAMYVCCRPELDELTLFSLISLFPLNAPHVFFHESLSTSHSLHLT